MSSKTGTILTILIAASLILSGANTLLLYNNQRATQEANDANRAAIDGVGANLTKLRQNLTALQGQFNAQGAKITDLGNTLSSISGKLTSVNDTLSAGLKSLNTTLEAHEKQTPAEVYKENYKSVVVISSDVGQGSGFVYDDKSHILTNWHVVNGTSKLEVEFYDGSRASAVVAGSDPYSDIAVITVSRMPADAAPLRLGNSSSASVGQDVVAIGNPLGLTGSLSSGHISQLNKLIQVSGIPLVVASMQLDITIAPGSSGGPLMDLSGEVLGITNAGTGYGINFAIPSSIVRRVAPALVVKGYYEHPLFGFSALELNKDSIDYFRVLNVPPDQLGLMITDVTAGSASDVAGLKPATGTTTTPGKAAYTAKDIVVAVNGHRVETFDDWVSYVEEHVLPGQQVSLGLWRSGDAVSVAITPKARPQFTG
jgi:S1-C subfamily serine protease